MNKFQYRLVEFGNKKSKQPKQSNQSNRSSNIEIDDIIQGSEFLDFNIKQEVITRSIMSVCIDEGIRDASYYRYVSQAINELTGDDTLQFFISSPGGTFSGLSALLSSMDYSGCNTVAVIQGDCSSAASMLALSCHEIQVSPLASMLVHFVSYGSAGAASHIKAHVDHTQKVTESVFRNIYEGFLTEEEIVSCIEQDRQIWLDSEQIIQRLENRLEYFKSKAKDTEEKEEDEEEDDHVPVKFGDIEAIGSKKMESLGYSVGYHDGYQDGFSECKDEGYQDGYDEGFKEGFKDAYDLCTKQDNTKPIPDGIKPLSDVQEGPTIDLNECTGTTLLPSDSDGSKSVVEGSVKVPVKKAVKTAKK